MTNTYQKLTLLVLVILLPFASWAKKNITLSDLYEKGTFSIKSVAGFNATPDGLSYLKIDKENSVQKINQYNIASGKLELNIYNHTDTINPIAAYELNKYNSFILLKSNPQPIYRRSTLYKTTLVNINTKENITLHDGKHILHATFSPNGDKIAYVYDNNIYIYDIIKNASIAITQDGKKNEIINGNCDWVYEEEFGFSQAYEWSEDGKYIAYYKFNESHVKEFTMNYYIQNTNYPTPYTFKYPKAGERNSIISIYSYDTENKLSKKLDIGAETDIYIPRIKWANASTLCIFRLNRHQNHLEFLYTNPTDGSSKIVYDEKNKYYVDIHDNVLFTQNGNEIILTSELNGFNHLYKYNINSKKLTPLTYGNWEIDAVCAIDEHKKLIYFTAGMTSHLERQLYVTNFNGSGLKQLTKIPGWVTVSALNGYKYFLVRHQSANSVPNTQLINASGKIIKTLEDNKKLAETINEYNLGKLSFIKIPNANNELLDAYIITPPNFDSNTKHPVLMYQYSGPGSQQVANKFQLDNYFWHQMLAQKGYIIVVADGTGTGGRGEEFKKKTYLQLGKLESDDQIAVANFLANQKFVDAERIGIWGWSYGGFMSSMCLFKAPKVFKAAIAVAPVTNWRFYDNIYTERYMRTPQENPKGYDDNAPEKLAKNLEGNFLLIHGIADDNVHFQNAVVLTNELIKANKQFRSEYYPNGNHGIGGGVVRYQLYQRMTDFILNEL